MDNPSLLTCAACLLTGIALTLTTQTLLHACTSSSSSPPPTSPPSTTDHAPPAEEIRRGLEDCIGNTPLILLKSLSSATGCQILGKAEFLNPGGSVKDRVALHLIRAGEASGSLAPHTGSTVYEGTVGSTGVSLAVLCRARGYLAHIVMPSDVASEKSSLLLKLGAAVELVAPAPIVDQRQFVNRARNLAGEDEKGYFADQFENDANWRAHYEGTAPEIWRQCGGRVDAFVAGAGTGGTLSGCARFLKERLPSLRVVLADPTGSGLYNRVKYGVMFDVKEREGTRRRTQVDTIVEGIGINRVTHNFEVGRELVEDAVRVTDEEAMAMARFLVEKEGIFVGSSSAVNCVAAVRTALKMGPGNRIVTILCDSGSRHLSKFWAKAGNVGDSWDMTIEDVLEADQRKAERESRKREKVGGLVKA